MRNDVLTKIFETGKAAEAEGKPMILRLGMRLINKNLKNLVAVLACVVGSALTVVGWAQTQPYPYPQQVPYGYPQQRPGYYPPQPYPPSQPYPAPSSSSGQAPIQAGVQQAGSGVGQQGGGENILIILDASYSMKEKLPSGETKMAAAKRIIMETLRKIPPEKRVGLRVYGQSGRGFSSCRATTLLVPIGMNNRQVMASQLLNVRPTGATPITFALTTAIRQDFGMPGKKTIILVSDGIETCDADPCDTAVAMLRAGVDVRINVVGFGLTDMDANRQLRCVALSTFGKYYTANTAAELGRGLENSMDVQTAVQGQILQKQPTTPIHP